MTVGTISDGFVCKIDAGQQFSAFTETSGLYFKAGAYNLSFAVRWPVAAAVRAGGWGLRRG
jgi:hypothetical protein